MKAILVAAGCLVLAAAAGPAIAQPAGPATPQQIAAAQALFAEMQPACSGGSQSKACGVVVYSPADCSEKKSGHVRQIYATYDDRTVRFQQNNTGIARQRPMALLAPFGIISQNGKNTLFGNPQFVSREAYEQGRKSVQVCGNDYRIDSKEFNLSDTLKKFLKANP